MIEAGSIFCGIPQSVVKQMRRVRDALGNGRFNINMKIGNIPDAAVHRGMELFRDKVLPEAKDLVMFTAHTAELASGPVHYQKGGSGPPILHLHPRRRPAHLAGGRAACRTPHDLSCRPRRASTRRRMHAGVKTMADLADLMAEFVAHR